VFVFVHEISFTSINFALTIITVAVQLKRYYNMNGINSTKNLGVVISGVGGGGYGIKLGTFLFGCAGFFVWFSVVAL
jgi:hypothetical protein